jgi:cell division transport system permease protein
MSAPKAKKRKVGSYPFLSVVFSVILALTVVGLFGLLLILTKSLTTSIQENVELQIYLDKSIRSSEITRISRTLGSKPYVLNQNEAESITLITEEEAARQFIEDTGEDFAEFLSDNPLRDLLLLKVEPSYQSLDSLNRIKLEIESIRGVYEVSFVETLVDSINRNLAKVGALLLGFFLIMLLVVIILINNTIKLALFSQRFLIRSMQLVGATASFIRRPFLIRASFYGLISGVSACVILYGILEYANRTIEDLSSLQSPEMLGILAGTLILLGIFVTYLSTFFAIKRYLKISLDELY